MENKKGVYVKEPTFLSLTDIHCRMIVDNLNDLSINEIKVIRENIDKYRVVSKKINEKSR